MILFRTLTLLFHSKDDATVPFLVADCVLVLIVLTLTQKSIKAEMEIEQVSRLFK